MWWRIVGIGLALALSTVLAWPSPPASPRITETDQRPVTIAVLPCRDNLQTTSSGFVIDDELVVTVAHGIYESRDFAIRDATGRWHDAKVIHLDLEKDLAVLRVRTLPASPMTLRVAERDDPVRMVEGAASGTTVGEVMRRVRLTTAVIGDLSTKTARSGYELSVDIKGGDSGAAIVDVDDHLVGLVFARSTRRDAAWATSVTEIERALDRRTVPEWECERRSNTELIREQRELAARH
jgi:S1-C subfamily serine protease